MIVLRVVAFALAGVGIGCAETAEHAAVAAFAPAEIRGSAFGLLATVQAAGNVTSSVVAGLLYTVASPTVAFGYLPTGCRLVISAADSVALASSPVFAPKRGTACMATAHSYFRSCLDHGSW